MIILFIIKCYHDVPQDTKPENLQQEKLAYLVQNAGELPFVRDMISKTKAWAYRNFPSLQKSLSLDDHDFANIALASLHNYAKDQSIRVGSFYSLQDRTIEQQDELKSIDEVLNKSKELR